MKVLQTLGQFGGAQAGIFQYRRTPVGVIIDASIGPAQPNPSSITIPHDDWNLFLTAIGNAPQRTFRITGARRARRQPQVSLQMILQAALPNPQGWNWNNGSWLSYICAILEHEGSIDLYHGGRNGIPIALRRDF